MALSADELAPRLAAQFDIGGTPLSIARHEGGHINDSFRVDAPRGAFLLQRLNPRVFPAALSVMENVAHVTAHCAAKANTRWRMPALVGTPDGRPWALDEFGATWRMFRFVEATVTETATTPAHAREAGRAFGAFTATLAGYDGPPLHETIRGFHNTPARFAQLEDAARRDPRGRLAGAKVELDALLAERAVGEVIPDLLRQGELPVRTTHNDAKIANVLFDDRGCAIGVVDLDTVMPGSPLFDVGDMIRSMASAAAEDERDLARVTVRPDFVDALLEGYLAEAGAVLTPRERSLLLFAGRAITLEQAVRFLTDHLDGDRYYRVTRAGQNLDRARAQFVLYRGLTELDKKREGRSAKGEE
jgi:aminoglycoside phosphotransferase (APT) family kinase protein